MRDKRYRVTSDPENSHYVYLSYDGENWQWDLKQKIDSFQLLKYYKVFYTKQTFLAVDSVMNTYE